jgi:adenylate cyclase
MATTVEWAQAGLLDGLDETQRAERIALLERLSAAGYSVDELREAAAGGLLPSLLADRQIAGVARYTGHEIADLAGIPLELISRIRQVGALPPLAPDERIYTDLDLEAATTTRRFLDLGIPEETIVRVSRVMGRTMGPLSEAFRDAVLDMFEDDVGELELAERLETLTENSLPLLRTILDQVSRSHFRNAVGSELSARLPHARADGRPVIVAFADLVGFTQLGTEVPASELGAVADRLEEIVADLVVPPVRIAKSLGDGVMLVSAEAGPLIATCLALVDAADAEGDAFPQVHVGIAAGEASTRAGDWFGEPVNLASRISDAARAGSVVVTKEVRDMAPDVARYSNAGSRGFKGIRQPVRLYRARPVASPGASAS